MSPSALANAVPVAYELDLTGILGFVFGSRRDKNNIYIYVCTDSGN
jgi:hypothetical protein